jgi:hypothetical protein
MDVRPLLGRSIGERLQRRDAAPESFSLYPGLYHTHLVVKGNLDKLNPDDSFFIIRMWR